jgi:hypothetical protein
LGTASGQFLSPDFASATFPVPANKSSETAMKISCVPPEMQTLALGAESARSEVPQLQGQKRRNKMYQNRVHLIGYLGKNPEAKTAKQSQRKYTVFSLATKRTWKGADEEWVSKTELWRIVSDAGVWRPLRGFSHGGGLRQNLPVVTTKSIADKADESRASNDQDSGL